MFIELLNPLPEGQYLDCAWPLTSRIEADMSLNTLKYAGYDATIEILPVIENHDGVTIHTHRYCIIYTQ